MSESNKYMIALQIENSDRFIEIFGAEVSSIAWNDIVAGFKETAKKILQRYRITSDVVSPFWGRCFLSFAAKQSSIPLDMEEQILVLTKAGKQLIREMLQNNLGMASGSKLNFKIIVAPVQEDFGNIQKVNEKLNILFKSLTSLSSPSPTVTRDQFIKIIEKKEIETLAQSIVSLPTEEIVGYEALSRGPSNSSIHRADMLFGTAAHFGLTQELELACIEKALDWIEKIPATLWMSFNIGPDLLKSSTFMELISQQHLKPFWPRLVFELTEHLPIESALEFQEIIRNFKSNGIRLSLDDTGCGFFDLNTVEKLKPDIVKLCITVISRIGRSNNVAKEIEDTVSKIARFGGKTLGEGVEKKQQLDVLKQCGVSLAQGYYFDKPKPMEKIF